MQDKITAFQKHVIEASANKAFPHHLWFVKWHLEVVAKIAAELCDYYPEADRQLVELMAWLHDYGKILDFDNEYQTTLTAGRRKLTELGFTPAVVDRAIGYIETLDKKLEVDLRQAPVEVQIVSSADGCSHLTGPFLKIFWNANTDQTFADRDFNQLMAGDERKIDKDWQRKIVLPEARRAFEQRYKFQLEQCGHLPAKFF